jgi:hypothetical protein
MAELSRSSCQLNEQSCTDKKEKKNFLIYKEMHNGAVAQPYMRKGFLIYEEIRKYLTIYEKAVSHIIIIYMILQRLLSEFPYP